MKRVLYLILLPLATGLRVQGQATANITVNIIAPSSISKTFESFSGNVPITSLDRPHSEIRGAGSRARLLKKNKGKIEVPAASFTLSESNNFTYSVSLPEKPIIARKGNAFISIENFSTHSPERRTASEHQSIDIRATVDLQSSTAGGTYSGPTPMTIVVNYN